MRMRGFAQHEDGTAFGAHETIGLGGEGWQRPVGDSIEACEKAMKDAGLAMTLMPPTMAVSMRPDRSASTA